MQSCSTITRVKGPIYNMNFCESSRKFVCLDSSPSFGNLVWQGKFSSPHVKQSSERHSLKIQAKKKDGNGGNGVAMTHQPDSKIKKKKEKVEAGEEKGKPEGGSVNLDSSDSDSNASSSEYLPTNFHGMKAVAHYPDNVEAHEKASKGKKKKDFSYSKEMENLQLELVKLQEWIKEKQLKVVVVFEGRDAAGKGGLIKTITEPLNPRVCSVVALGTPSDRERHQWYFQRYVARLPAAGEMVLFDRSWYNRAGVEKVMGFCTDSEYKEFMRSCPEFERMLVRSGIKLIKYWVSVSPEEQERRFKERLRRPEKRWKLSPMDLHSRARWSEYSYAKDVMFSCCDIKQAPWYVIPADNKKAARLNCISHLLSLFPYEDLIVPNDVDIPPLQEEKYVRPPVSDQTFVPQIF